MRKNINCHQHGYQIKRQLGNNPFGGSVTYLATETQTKLPVVIKQFKFAQSGASWAEYEAHQQEIEVLRNLSHPNIPLYLDDFETPTGFCLVTEYKSAPSLAVEQNFTPTEIKQIALGVLEILVYLQQHNPPIIHGDIKPENILVERGKHIQVYLAGFGRASQVEPDIATPSSVEGTLGFMPPEQLLKHPLNKASDLYSLGATLICLLTGTPAQDICQLLDESYSFQLKPLESKVSPQFIKWLSNMVAPKVKDRYATAAVALKALKSVPVVNSLSFSSLIRGFSPRVFPPLLTLATIGIAAGFISTLRNIVVINPPQTMPITAPVTSLNPVSRLLQTGECSNCDLRRAYLQGASLEGTNLHFANLRAANLQGASLQGANLQMSNLEDASLQGANLQGAYPRNANLVRAKLNGANLQGADLFLANLEEAQLRGANLEGAQLEEAKLEGAYLEGANLQHANLRYVYLGFAFLDSVNLEGANLDSANLESAFLYSAYLKDANLDSANLQGATLQAANLQTANLENANLEGANLMKANLMGANLKGANLRYADLRGANLRYADLRGANLEGTIMPNGRIARGIWPGIRR